VGFGGETCDEAYLTNLITVGESCFLLGKTSQGLGRHTVAINCQGGDSHECPVCL